ncbi:hypothetical protein AZE42_10258 [Rhizopogon vesiculosus]|uniref:Uncharacterized protein n=1 Tax=Rhizopogon vesiculosus TaxID=180088 RepID=A0A1J8PNZ9_9AGAM|nr:hypothetical protein AZE42_10258 [Rhizopogon vesiculosus]
MVFTTKAKKISGRTSLGLSAAKDCLHLLRLWLANLELHSRCVKHKSFGGIDWVSAIARYTHGIFISPPQCASAQ